MHSFYLQIPAISPLATSAKCYLLQPHSSFYSVPLSMLRRSKTHLLCVFVHAKAVHPSPTLPLFMLRSSLTPLPFHHHFVKKSVPQPWLSGSLQSATDRMHGSHQNSPSPGLKSSLKPGLFCFHYLVIRFPSTLDCGVLEGGLDH